jgi:hypothetical protein
VLVVASSLVTVCCASARPEAAGLLAEAVLLDDAVLLALGVVELALGVELLELQAASRAAAVIAAPGPSQRILLCVIAFASMQRPRPTRERLFSTPLHASSDEA